MTDSLLLRSFRQLLPKDLRILRDVVRSPVFNRREEVIRLFDYLAETIGKPAPEAFQPEQLFAAAFPGQAYDNRPLRHTMSYLLAVLRQYLAWSEWQSEPGEEQRYLLRALRRRNLEALAEKEWQIASSDNCAAPVRDAQYYFKRYQLYEEQMERTTRHERSGGINLQALPDELTVFYVAEMLRHACAALSHQAIAGQSYRIGLLDTILNAVEQEAMLHVPVVAVYFHAYKMLQSPEAPEHFQQLKTLLGQQENTFSRRELRGLYLLAINGCIRRMNAGQRDYIREAFDLYRLALERDFLTENGFLSGFTYKNIIRIGVALDEHEWARQFLEQYRQALHPRERDNLYRYNRAFLHFQQQDYARAMPLLQQVDLEDPLNNLDARRMLLRSYFELGEWQALDSLLQSFSAHLRRQKNLGYHRQSNENLLFFTKKLLEIDRNDRKAMAALRRELEAKTEVAERAWLLQQM